MDRDRCGLLLQLHACGNNALPPAYFQRHRKLATARVVIMYIIYGLWLVVAVRIISPNKPKDSEKLPSVASKFRHAATVIEVIGIMWIYLLTYLPVFLSEQAAEVRTIVSRVSPSAQDIVFIREWLALGEAFVAQRLFGIHMASV